MLCLYLNNEDFLKIMMESLKEDDRTAIEFEGMEGNITAIRIGLDNLKKYINEVGL